MSFIQSVDDRINVQRDWMKDYNFHLVDSLKKLETLVDTCIKRKICSLDVESTGLDNRIYPDSYFKDNKKTKFGIRTVDRVAGLCISFDGKNGYYIPLSHIPEDSGNLPWDESWELIEKLVHNCKIIFHNSKFDQEFIYPMTGKDFWKKDEFEDTYFIAKVHNPLKGAFPGGLKQLTEKFFRVNMIEIHDLFSEEKMIELRRNKEGLNFAALHPKEGLEYGCSDGIFTYKLYFELIKLLNGSDFFIYDIEKNFCNVIRKMERNRVHLDVELIKQLDVECDKLLDSVGEDIRGIIKQNSTDPSKWTTLNVGSNTQLLDAMFIDFDGMRLKIIGEMKPEEKWDATPKDDDDESEKEDSAYTLDDGAIKALNLVYGGKYFIEKHGKKESIFNLILEYRHYSKMKGSFTSPLIKAVDEFGDVRPSLNQFGTDTARMSGRAGKISDGYSGINFQGIPRDSDDDKPELFKQMRSCIIPRPGKFLVKLDFVSEELRVVTNLSGDPVWTESFLSKDGDVHSITARSLLEKKELTKDERNKAGKGCNFAIIYGGGAGAISRNIGCSMDDAQKKMDKLRGDIPVIMEYIEKQKRYARKHLCIYTSFGRRIPIPTINDPSRPIRAKAERCSINYTVQATSADILKLALIIVDKNLREKGLEEHCKYVLTVHDEVVYEISPEYLQDLIRSLNEWMVYPWKIEKKFGLEWKVPLLTEPGIDVNWKARYDYFKMIDGIPIKPVDLNSDGEFIGKLKKDEYVHKNRIYQKVPDVLKNYIRRQDQVDGEVETPRITSEIPPKSEIIVEESLDTLGSDVSLDDLSDSSKTESKLPDSKSPDTKPSQSGFSEPKTIEEPKIEEPKIEKEKADKKLFKWTMRSSFNEHNMKKLHAVCILAEGETPLQISSKDGVVRVSEEEGLTVDENTFLVITKLFGI